MHSLRRNDPIAISITCLGLICRTLFTSKLLCCPSSHAARLPQVRPDDDHGILTDMAPSTKRLILVVAFLHSLDLIVPV
jgi:hypothetical protein